MAEKVAIIHDWLNGMRGGEKVLEEILALYPEADIFTLFYEPEAVSPLIRSKQVTASRLNRNPWIRKHYQLFPALVPPPYRSLRPERLFPGDQQFALRGQGGDAGARCPACQLYPFADALCLGPVLCLFRRAGYWRRKIIQREISRLRAWDVGSAARVDHFVGQFQSTCASASKNITGASRRSSTRRWIPIFFNRPPGQAAIISCWFRPWFPTRTPAW